VIKTKFKIYKWQRVNVSDIFATVRTDGSGVLVNTSLPMTSLVVSNVDLTVMDRDQDEQEQTRHWQWRVYTILYKDVTSSDAFIPLH
jgi:hypothetical protein